MNATWQELNAEGLALADGAHWGDATAAFERALAELDSPDAAGSITSAAHDDARARVLLNIGQCQFHLGNFEQSRRFAERSCGLRVGLYGEDSLIVARTRGDLAVILAAAGQTDEAMSLLERAVSAVERKRGAESAFLLPLLTNAARLLARSAPERATAYIARLKALMFAQQLAQHSEIFPKSDLPAHSYSGTQHSAGADDHLLRAAVAQTVDLLRSTPRANLAMPGATFGADRAQVNSDTVAPISVVPDASEEIFIEPLNGVHNSETPDIDVVTVDDILPMLPHDIVVTQPQLNPSAPEKTQSVEEASVEVLWEYEVPAAVESPAASTPEPIVEEIDDTLFDLVEPPPPTLNAIPRPADPRDATRVNPLGFEVQYGIPSQLHESFDNPTAPLPDDAAPVAAVDSDLAHASSAARSGVRAVGGARRGSTQVIAMNRVWIAVACVGAFSGGIGAFFLYNYIRHLMR